VFLNNLSENVSEEDIREIFEEFGEFQRFKMIPLINTSTGKCWIAFESAEKAKQAIEKFADTQGKVEIGGRTAYISLSLT
jgi:RNA recognition motif-containing protein